MKKLIYSVCLCLLSYNTTFAQTKKVLIEETTGTACSGCPMGSYLFHQLLETYPNVVGVTLHNYGMDKMYNINIDTIGDTYALGAPMATVDRVKFDSTINLGWVADAADAWEQNILTRLDAASEVSINLDFTWNSTTRKINAILSTSILTDLPEGDYRFGLYIVEDNVTGLGYGYDQYNSFNDFINSPMYGLGNPIPGYVHRHVARAILPNAWGQQGVIASSPIAGTNFSTNFQYTVPLAYKSLNMKLVGFAYRFSSDHQLDEVLNVEEKVLLPTLAVSDNDLSSLIEMYPNPTSEILHIDGLTTHSLCEIFSLDGRMILTQALETEHEQISIAHLNAGLYILQVRDKQSTIAKKLEIMR